MLLLGNDINDRMKSDKFYPQYAAISKVVFVSVMHKYITSVCSATYIVLSVEGEYFTTGFFENNFANFMDASKNKPDFLQPLMAFCNACYCSKPSIG